MPTMEQERENLTTNNGEHLTMSKDTPRALENTAKAGNCGRHSWVQAFDVKTGKGRYRFMCEHCDATITLKVDAYGDAEHIGGSYSGGVLGILTGPEPKPVPKGCGCKCHAWEEYLPRRQVACRYELVCIRCSARVILHIEGDGFVEMVISPSSNPHHHADPEAQYLRNRDGEPEEDYTELAGVTHEYAGSF